MFEQAFKNIDDVLWKEAGCTTELDYTEQTSWLLFLDEPDRMGRWRLIGNVQDDLSARMGRLMQDTVSV